MCTHTHDNWIPHVGRGPSSAFSQLNVVNVLAFHLCFVSSFILEALVASVTIWLKRNGQDSFCCLPTPLFSWPKVAPVPSSSSWSSRPCTVFLHVKKKEAAAVLYCILITGLDIYFGKQHVCWFRQKFWSCPKTGDQIKVAKKNKYLHENQKRFLSGKIKNMNIFDLRIFM